MLNYWQKRYIFDMWHGFMISCVLLVIGNTFLTPKITMEMLPQYFAAMTFFFVFASLMDFELDINECRKEMFDRFPSYPDQLLYNFDKYFEWDHQPFWQWLR